MVFYTTASIFPNRFVRACNVYMEIDSMEDIGELKYVISVIAFGYYNEPMWIRVFCAESQKNNQIPTLIKSINSKYKKVSKKCSKNNLLPNIYSHQQHIYILLILLLMSSYAIIHIMCYKSCVRKQYSNNHVKSIDLFDCTKQHLSGNLVLVRVCLFFFTMFVCHQW